MSRIQKLKIAHIVYSFGYGGLERRILRLIESLSPLGAEFLIVSLRNSSGEFLPSAKTVEHVVLGAQPGLDPGAIWRLAKILRERDVHIVHSHNWVSMLEGVLAARIARIPVAVHGEHGAKRFEPQELRWRRTLTQRLVARITDRIVPVNESIRDRLVDVWRLPPKDFTIIRNGVDTEKFKPTQPAASATIRVGSIGRLDPVKNFPCLIKAIAELNQRKDDQRYELAIVGAGEEHSSLEALIRTLNISNFVKLAGASDEPEDWYKHFDIFVNCSFSEGMSNTVLEAMACGLPIVVTDIAGHRDWLDEGSNAVFFTSDDAMSLATAIKKLADTPKLANDMRANNRKKIVNDYNQSRFANAYLDLYGELLKSKDLYFSFTPVDSV